jgi:hypothetical protein
MQRTLVGGLIVLVACAGPTQNPASPPKEAGATPSTIVASPTESTSPTPSRSPRPNREVVATRFGNDLQRSIQDRGFSGMAVTSKTVRSVPGYGKSLLLRITVQDDADNLEAAVYTMLAVGEIIPAYESDLETLGIEYVAIEDESGGRMFGLVGDFLAYADGEIGAVRLRDRMFFEI